MTRIGLVAAMLAFAGCTSVKMVQRDGCWVKQTGKWPSGVDEQLAFCTKPAPVWAQDRAARMVQECMSQADYRWENRALAAWSHGQPVPDVEADGKTAETCMKEVSASLGLEAENAALKARLNELTQEREALRTAADKDRVFLEQSHDNVVSALGEAAKKPPQSAVATATSTGTAKSETEARPALPAAPAMTVVELNGAPVVTAPAKPAAPAPPACGARKAGGKAGLEGGACLPVVSGAPRTN